MEWWQRLFNSPIYFELYEAGDTCKSVGQVRDLLRLLAVQPPRLHRDRCDASEAQVGRARRGAAFDGERGRGVCRYAGVMPDILKEV